MTIPIINIIIFPSPTETHPIYLQLTITAILIFLLPIIKAFRRRPSVQPLAALILPHLLPHRPPHQPRHIPPYATSSKQGPTTGAAATALGRFQSPADRPKIRPPSATPTATAPARLHLTTDLSSHLPSTTAVAATSYGSSPAAASGCIRVRRRGPEPRGKEQEVGRVAEQAAVEQEAWGEIRALRDELVVVAVAVLVGVVAMAEGGRWVVGAKAAAE